MFGSALLTMMVFGTLGGFFVAWPLAFVYRFFSGQPSPTAPPENQPWTTAEVLWEARHRLWTGRFLPWTPRRHVPWTFIDLVVLLLLAILLLFGFSVLLGGLRGPPVNGQGAQPAPLHLSALADSAWKIAVMFLATLYLVFKAGIRCKDFGLSARNLGTHILIGVVTFVMIAPPVYAIQAAIVWFGKWKYEHPLIEMLQKSPDIGLFLILAFSACVMAPLSEEWLFRGLLQGWLERGFAWLGARFDSAEHDPLAADPSLVSVPLVEAASIDQPPLGELPIAAHANPYTSSASVLQSPAIQAAPPVQEQAEEQPFPRSLLVHWPPILFSAVLFGLAHWGHGPAPIPLTVLALALGYVYQRTHSIVPVIVVHALFNSLSMLMFYVYMFELKQPLP